MPARRERRIEQPRRTRRIIRDKDEVLDQRGHAKLLNRDPLKKRRAMERTAIQKRNDMITAIVENRGLIMKACKQAGISYRTHRYWYKTRRHYRRRVNEALEEAYDEIEWAGIIRPANEGSMAAANTFLSARAKDRGYGGFRQELTGKDGNAIEMRGPTLEEIMEKTNPDSLLKMLERVAKNANQLSAETLRLENKNES